MPSQRILITNAKGGCGKTTVATNIASYFASQGKNVRLFDYDNQSSSLQWCKRRPEHLPKIHGVDASRRPDNRMTRSWQMRVPLETDLVVVDTPAGIDTAELASMFIENDYLIIPVLPSPIDIQATAYFIRDILLVGKARKRQIKVAVIANRARKNTHMYHALERFLFSLDIPFITSLRDTQFYARAIEQGCSVLELKHSYRKTEEEQWAPLLRWINSPISESVKAEIHSLFPSEERHRG